MVSNVLITHKDSQFELDVLYRTYNKQHVDHQMTMFATELILRT